MTIFDERKRGEEGRFRHEQELGFRIRNRRNRLFGTWIAQDRLGLGADEAAAYARDVVTADFEMPGDSDVLGKVKADLGRAGKEVPDHVLDRRLRECEARAREQVVGE